MNKIIQGDCLEELKKLPDNSVDSIVTDPPYELGFMGKSWDSTGIANNVELWKECLRVLKPGGHLLAFSGTRTYHRMASAIEDAGFEVRDMIEWVYGSGFPKSLNIAKSIESKLKTGSCAKNNFHQLEGERRDGRIGMYDTVEEHGFRKVNPDQLGAFDLEATTQEAKQWEGWGTALKPAHEPICMARKPLAEKTVAQNVLEYGTGGINIDESRVAANWKEERPESWFNSGKSKSGEPTYDGNLKSLTESTVGERLHDDGRFPANLIHDNSEEVRECFPESKSSPYLNSQAKNVNGFHGGVGTEKKLGREDDGGFSDQGNASRFFKSIIYQAKASKSERNKGCEGLEEKPKVFNGQSDKPSTDMKDVEKRFTTLPKANNHPTVKPIALMEYLIKMVTPKGGIVLDPFAGSGSTLVSAKENGYQYIGIERESEYINIINARLNN